MKKYRFENFNVELVNPTIETLTPTYSIGSETVKVHATLNANENRLFGVFLGEMENTDGWGDSDVMDFAVNQLETFLVVE